MSEALEQAKKPPADVEEDDIETESLPEEAQPSDNPSEEELPLDQVFGILKNQRRRYVLKFLKDSDEEEVSLSDVAEQIAAWENDKEVRQISSKERKRVYVGLYQCHLPKMDGMGIVAFNKPRGRIGLGENSEPLFKYIDTDDEPEEPRWHVYSVALSLAGAVMLGAALLLGSLTALPVVNAAVVFLIVAFTVYPIININWLRVHGTEDDEER